MAESYEVGPAGDPSPRRNLSREEAAWLLYTAFMDNADAGDHAVNTDLVNEMCRRTREQQHGTE